MKLILHFGIHRTGSTSIQRNLAANREVLKQHGFLYPHIEGVVSPQSLPAKLNVEAASLKRLFRKVEKQATQETHTVILSSEDLCTLGNYKFLEDIPQKFDVRVVLYLRRQDLWLESWYNQHVKWPWDADFSGSDIHYFVGKIKNFPWIDYKNLLARIERFLPRDKLHVESIGETGAASSVDDFLKFCSINPGYLQKENNKNQSLSSAKIDILRRIDMIDLQESARLKILRGLGKIKIREDNGTRIFLTRSERETIISNFSESNLYVARRYFQRDKLFTEYLSKQAHPALVGDINAYQEYIPQILKKIAEE